MKSFLLPAVLVVFLGKLSAQTGIAIPTMTATDNLVNNFIATYNIPGATFAIAKDGKIVYLRSFGYADVAKTQVAQPNQLYRIASLSKQITSVTILKMIENGQLTLSSKVFGTGGILEHHPVFSTTTISDARIYDITIQHLLEHSAGWNRDVNCLPNPTVPYPYFQTGCDPISFPLHVTQQTGITNPVTKDALIKFVLQKGLNFTPGTSYNYSNMGYLILGEVIEQLSGQSYEAYVQQNILAPLGIFDMHIANNLRANKQEREVEYTGNGGSTLSLYGDGTNVPWEYGGFSVSAMDAHGGWIASARDMLKFLTAVDGFSTKPDILLPATIASMVTPSANYVNYAKGWSVNAANNWWHTGSLDGTATEWVRSASGYTWVILLNKRQNTNAFWTALDNLGWNCIANTTTWPTHDLMDVPTTNASNVTFTNVTNTSMTVNWTNGNGEKRLLLAREDQAISNYPSDGTNYTANSTFGGASLDGSATKVVYNGTGSSVTVTGLTANKTYYFRLVEFNQSSNTGNNALHLLGNNLMASQTAAATLPANFSYVKAVPKEGSPEVVINWGTAQESNNDHFDVQRSGDGVNFTTIGTVAGHGNSAVPQNYVFTDRNGLPGASFYRIRQVDKDARFSYSSIVSVRVDLKGIIVTPNPASHFIEVRGIGIRQVQLIDLMGQVVVNRQPAGTAGNRIDITSLSKGVYVVKVVLHDGQSTTKRLIVQ